MSALMTPLAWRNDDFLSGGRPTLWPFHETALPTHSSNPPSPTAAASPGRRSPPYFEHRRSLSGEFQAQAGNAMMKQIVHITERAAGLLVLLLRHWILIIIAAALFALLTLAGTMELTFLNFTAVMLALHIVTGL